MAIPFTKYVNITSAVAGGNAIPVTELITRCMTSNPLVPSGGAALEFTSATAVRQYFGQSSEEYLRAAFYFNWISKLFTSPQKISYAFWASADTFPLIFGADLTLIGTTLDELLDELKEVTTGAFAITIGGTTHQVTGLDFSSAASLSDVADAIQTKINAFSGTQWTDATVVYSATNGASFNFTGGDNSVAAAISLAAPASGFDVRALLGWNSNAQYPYGAVFSNGVQTETLTETMDNTVNQSDNFGSFLFIPTLNETQIEEVANWNLLQNNEFVYLIPGPTDTDVRDYADTLNLIGGSVLTFAPISTEYPEMVPGMISAATNYNLPNANQNYMFQGNFNLTPSVTDGSIADQYDALQINYYGQTQTAGTLQSFYQDGVMTGAGVDTNPIDINTYVNEQWLKNALTAALGNLLINSTAIPANDQGVTSVINAMQEVINLATTNGVISINGFLTNDQKGAITDLTNDPDAWRQVQTIGYWLSANIATYNVGPSIRYEIQYLLVYKKNDAIRRINGTNILV